MSDSHNHPQGAAVEAHGEHTHGHSPEGGHRPHAHGHAHGKVEPPATSGRLIRAARFYDLRVGLMLLGTIERMRTQALDRAGVRPGQRVLDVGCGTGGLALAAARRVGQGGLVQGIDASPEMIEEARRKAAGTGGNVRFDVQPVEAMSFPDGSFDVVLSSLMIHHLSADLKLRALAEIRRVLKPGGRIVVVDLQAISRTLRPWEPGWLVTKMHRMPASGDAPAQADGAPLADLLRQAGFTHVEHGTTRYAWLGYARGTN